MAQPTITYQGYSIQCYIEGEGEAIVFLHGWPTNATLWQSQVEALKSSYKVITFDWLGFGASDQPEDGHHTFIQMKEILTHILSSLLPADEKVTIVAHDIGGPPGLLWASENTHRINRLILLNTVIYPFKTSTEVFSDVILKIPFLKDWFVSPVGLQLVMKSMTKRRGGAITERMTKILRIWRNAKTTVKRKTLIDPLHEGRKKGMYRLNEKFKELTIEKYLVIAKHDALCYAHIQKLSVENPEVPTLRLNDCGHFIAIEAPELLTDLLLGILKGEFRYSEQIFDR